MKENKLGDFEEVLMLLVGILSENAYAFRIAEEYTQQTNKSASIGAVHSTLNRLEEKGFLNSFTQSGTAQRGGRRKRVFEITASGQKVLEASRALKMSLWSQFPAFNFGSI